jgi:lipopolysaccharide/colanic/teichoic acid biosynthesis glycosyltransferase
MDTGRTLKSIFDRMFAVFALCSLFPLILAVSVLVYIKMGSPIVFAQRRPGKNSKIFKFYKFRTMTEETDQNGNLLPDAQRLTPFGQFLRQTSLDELPQLWNVLNGDMSLVGPRPLLVEYLGRYSPQQARRHEVKPGITGWAQVNGRRLLDGNWQRKLELDVWYVDNWSLWLDMKILLLTIWKVFKKEGITQAGQATGEEFRGNAN